MNYYPHHIGDFNNATRHLTRIERSVYRDLIELYYDTEQPLPGDMKAICRKILAGSTDEREAVEQVLSEFFQLVDGVYRHERCDDVIAAYKAKAEKNKANGVKGGRPKKAEGEPKENPVGSQTVSECEPKKTLTNNQEPRTKEIPHTPQAGQKAERAIALETYLELCKQNNEKPIPEGDSVFSYADEIGLSHDFLRLQWLEFKARYSLPGAKRYKAWPIVFGKSVRGNWFKLWFAKDGQYALTTAGIQAKKLHEGRA